MNPILQSEGRNQWEYHPSTLFSAEFPMTGASRPPIPSTLWKSFGEDLHRNSFMHFKCLRLACLVPSSLMALLWVKMFARQDGNSQNSDIVIFSLILSSSFVLPLLLKGIVDRQRYKGAVVMHQPAFRNAGFTLDWKAPSRRMSAGCPFGGYFCQETVIVITRLDYQEPTLSEPTSTVEIETKTGPGSPKMSVRLADNCHEQPPMQSCGSNYSSGVDTSSGKVIGAHIV